MMYINQFHVYTSSTRGGPADTDCDGDSIDLHTSSTNVHASKYSFIDMRWKWRCHQQQCMYHLSKWNPHNKNSNHLSPGYELDKGG